MELIKVGEKTYYIKNNTNIGIYLVDETSVFLIDSGNDKDCGKKILKMIEENGWVLKGIINTHSNADHIGGNKILEERTNCEIFSYGIEQCFIKYPELEPAFLYGGFPFSDLQNKFLMAKASSKVNDLSNLPDGLDYFRLKGHFFDMIGIKTSDDVYFLGDSIFSFETIQKYSVFFLYDVKDFLNTLDFLETLEGKFYIPSHVEASSSISSLIQLNREKVLEICDVILSFCIVSKTFEEILEHIFGHYSLTMNLNQYVLIGSTIRSYLSYLYDENKLIYEFVHGKMFWKVV